MIDHELIIKPRPEQEMAKRTIQIGPDVMMFTIKNNEYLIHTNKMAKRSNVIGKIHKVKYRLERIYPKKPFDQ